MENKKPSDDKEAVKGQKQGPLSVSFPVNLDIWGRVRNIVPDTQVRINSLATDICEDPVLVIEFLRASSSMHFSQGRAPVTTVKAAIERLGVDATIETLDKIKETPQIEDPDIARHFEICRSSCKNVGKVAKLAASLLASSLSDDCEVAGLLFRTGELIAVVHFGIQYVEVAEGQKRPKILYRLEKDFKFDGEAIGLTYLQRAGVPEGILFALNRSAKAKTPSRGIIKPICMAANEMVAAFESGRWEKIAPSKTLPPTSPIRMLGLTAPQYERLYEQASEVLFPKEEAEENN